jgi:hypothetical protein
MENEGEIIIKCGVDGGSWTLVGRRGPRGGWRFRASRDEGTLRDFIDDKDWESFEFHMRRIGLSLGRLHWRFSTSTRGLRFCHWPFTPISRGGFGRQWKIAAAVNRTNGRGTVSRTGVGCAGGGTVSAYSDFE